MSSQARKDHAVRNVRELRIYFEFYLSLHTRNSIPLSRADSIVEADPPNRNRSGVEGGTRFFLFFFL